MAEETKNYFVGDRAGWSKTPFKVALNYGRDADAHNTRTRICITPDAEFLLTTTTEKDGTETTIQKVKGTSIWPGSGMTLTIMVEHVSGEGGNGGFDCEVGGELVATIKEVMVCNKDEEVPACFDQPNLADQQMTFGVGSSLERCLNVQAEGYDGFLTYFPIKAEEETYDILSQFVLKTGTTDAVVAETETVAETEAAAETEAEGEEAPASPKLMADAEWEGDLQYMSLYLDRKEQVEDENQAYLEAHPAVRQMCSDFLLHLMHRKPDDVVDEARGFFKQYSQQVAPSKHVFELQ